MRDSHVLTDYEAVKPPRWHGPRAEGEGARPSASDQDASAHDAGDDRDPRDAPEAARGKRAGESRGGGALAEVWNTRRGHALSYAGLFLFTAFVYFRPYELFSLPALADGALYCAILTLLAFMPAQLAAEGNFTARPREVNLILLLTLAAVLSIPLAISPTEAWDNFVNFGKVIVMFIVMVNVVRTERRLHWLLLLTLAASAVMSIAALRDYAAGNFGRDGRVKGIVGGLFDNPNDLALYLVTSVPIALCLALGRRGLLRKLVYGATALTVIAAVVITFSRGGFLGLVAASAVLAWKLARKNRVLVVALALVAVAVFAAAAPSEYGSRLSSMFGGDMTGSANARQALFWRSVVVSLRYPLFGVGLGNFHFKSIQEQVSHNSYTQVSSEMGMAALVVYCLFMVTALKRLRSIERETLGVKDRVRFYYLSAGLQASIVGYMVSSFFASVAHLWYVYYLVGYAVCLRRLYAVEEGSAASRRGAAAGVAERPDLEAAGAPTGGVTGR